MSHDEILILVCQLLSVSIDDLKSTVRKREVVYARKLSVFYLNKKIADPQIIAKYLNKSSDTIYSYRNSFDKELQYNKTLRYLKSQCDAIINN